MEKGMFDACVAQLVRPVDRQSKDPGSNPGAVESLFFYRKIFNIWKWLKNPGTLICNGNL